MKWALLLHWFLPLGSSGFVLSATQRHGRRFGSTLHSAVAQEESSGENTPLPSRISYRSPLTDKDIEACHAIEFASYPADEAASLESLQYRRTHALDYFQCAQLDNNTIIGFVCGTRCDDFREESMSTHAPNGRFLAIHSVVVSEEYRRQGVATAMLRAYLDERVKNSNDGKGAINATTAAMIQSIVLLAKSHLLGFYVNCGFRVNRPSPIVHGQELWYELELSLVQSLPSEGESWFCKTEQFQRPYPEVKPHLEAHKAWVDSLRRQGRCITSGYRVDAQGKPGGGGLLFLAAPSYEEAMEIVLQDPLVANDCVDWELNGWIGQVGEIQMR